MNELHDLAVALYNAEEAGLRAVILLRELDLDLLLTLLDEKLGEHEDDA